MTISGESFTQAALRMNSATAGTPTAAEPATTQPDELRRFIEALEGHALTTSEKASVLIVLGRCADEIERLRSVMRRVAGQTTDSWAHERLLENRFPETPNARANLPPEREARREP